RPRLVRPPSPARRSSDLATRALSPTHPFGLPFRGNSAKLRGPVPRVKSVRCDPRRDPHSEDLPCLVRADIPVRITVRPEVPISGARGSTLRAPHTPVNPERPFSTWTRPHAPAPCVHPSHGYDRGDRQGVL